MESSDSDIELAEIAPESMVIPSAVIDITEESPGPSKKRKRSEKNTKTHSYQKKDYVGISKNQPERITYLKVSKLLVENEDYDGLWYHSIFSGS